MGTLRYDRKGVNVTSPKFPSHQVLEQLAQTMNHNEETYRALGYVDCRFGIQVEDTGEAFTVVLEGYGCGGIEDGLNNCEFVLTADSDTWQAMYDDIVRNGHASLEQTLNYHALPGFNLRIVAEDQLAEDFFYRYNQTLQNFFDGAGQVVAAA